MLREPIAVNRTQAVSGTISFDANDSFSYTLTVQGTSMRLTPSMMRCVMIDMIIRSLVFAMLHDQCCYPPPLGVGDSPVLTDVWVYLQPVLSNGR
jgi:hypothetical protein